MKKNLEKIFLITIALLWILIISSLTWWNIGQLRVADREKNLETARALFDIIVASREWNSKLGGVYVPVSDEIQPNPYLEVPDRDVLTTDGVSLTKINPAYMTRLIGEIVQENYSVTYHITSLDPIRPENEPEFWEKLALFSFEDGNPEYIEWNETSQTFRYMAPLYVEESCLACHAQQGYQVGDVRGGISVSFPTQTIVIWPTLLTNLVAGIIGLVGIFVFGIQLLRAFSKLEQQTEIDGLTQINNRYYFDDYFHREYLRARRMRSPLSVIICDIDDFKAYNDAYGHQAGDACLKSVAQALREVLHRPGDLVARYGGEEFGIILPDTPQEGASTVAELLRARIEALEIKHKSSRASKFVTISLGVATFDGENITQEILLETADKALYLAKDRGRNLVAVMNVL